MENKLCVMNLCLRVEIWARRKHLKEGKGLTSPLLVLHWVPGLQNELALHLWESLIWKEAFPVGRRIDGGLWSLWQQQSRWKMAHFNSIRMFMPCMEKNLNVNSSWWWWLSSKLPYCECVHHTGICCSSPGDSSPEWAPYPCLWGTHCKNQVLKEKILKREKLKHFTLFGIHRFISALVCTMLALAVSIWEYLRPSSFWTLTRSVLLRQTTWPLCVLHASFEMLTHKLIRIRVNMLINIGN